MAGIIIAILAIIRAITNLPITNPPTTAPTIITIPFTTLAAMAAKQEIIFGVEDAIRILNQSVTLRTTITDMHIVILTRLTIRIIMMDIITAPHGGITTTRVELTSAAEPRWT